MDDSQMSTYNNCSLDFYQMQNKYNEYLIDFMDLTANPIVEIYDFYDAMNNMLAECYDAQSSYIYIISYNAEYGALKVKYCSKKNHNQTEIDDIALALARKQIDSERVTVYNNHQMSQMLATSVIPNKSVVCNIMLDKQLIGAMVIFTFDASYNYLYDNYNRPNLTFIANGIALAYHKKSFDNRLNSLIYNDYLTQLSNRTRFIEMLVSAMQFADIHNTMLAVLMVDIDGIRTINDSLGYDVGDYVIQWVARNIKSAVEDENPVARFGADDFAVLLPVVDSMAYVHEICERIIDAMKNPVQYESKTLNISVSIGASVFPYNGESADMIIKNADAAMNQSKRNGRSGYKVYNEEMTRELEQVLFLENQLRDAIEVNQFELYYQGQLDLKTNRIESVEALIRWIHPEKGIILPYDFIPFAEDNGLIIPIDQFVVLKACEQAKVWADKGLNIVVGINISPKHFRDGDVVKVVADALEQTQLPPNLIKIEILESVLIEDLNYTLQIINRLKDIGVSVSLDDFGSGYSSLEYVTTLPLDTIKIDRSFSMKLEENPNNKIIIKTIISLAKEMGLEVIAEGVEKQSQLEFIKEHGCDCAQGYLINRPMPVYEMEKLIYKYNGIEDDNFVWEDF